MWLISGQAGIDGSGKVVGPDFKAQVTQAFENLKKALNGAGLDFSDLVSIRSYIVDLPANIATYRDVRVKYVQGERVPTSTTIGVQALATEGALVEIDGIAVARGESPNASAPPAANSGVMVTSILRALPGKQADLRQQLLKRVEVSRKEPGCISYNLYQSSEDPSLFILHENWTDMPSLQRHFQTPDHEGWSKIRSNYVADRQVNFWKPAE
jgi:enamine deaminase RidA (YjgF/YER057c/UK114 family)/quinol monooxygenase YgiN